jgi:hypothetical protein
MEVLCEDNAVLCRKLFLSKQFDQREYNHFSEAKNNDSIIYFVYEDYYLSYCYIYLLKTLTERPRAHSSVQMRLQVQPVYLQARGL